MSDWLEFFDDPEVLVFMIPITAILVGGIIVIVKLLLRHRERMGLIEQGLHPDRLPDDDGDPSTE